MKRKHIYNIGIGILTILIASCQHSEEPYVPTEGYIYFNTEVASRGELVTEMIGKDFGVMGYEYNGDWNTVKVQAKPNLFHAQTISWNETDKIHTYSPLKPWEAGKKYTFYGYYPTVGVTISGNSIEGVPYLTYTLPNSPADMKDIMTATLYDTDNSASNSVGLTFQHRLVAMNVQARNFNTPHNGKDVYVKLSNVSITYTNLKYNQVTLPMDATLPMNRVEASNKSKTYSILGNQSVLIPPTDTSTGETTAIDISNLENQTPTTLILIPQEGTDEANDYLKGTISFTFDYVDNTGKTIIINDAAKVGQRNLNFDIGKNIVAGRKYALLMNFSRTSVTIAIVESGEWTDQDIDIEFE